MATTLELELDALGREYPELAKRLKGLLGDGTAYQAASGAPSLDERKEVFQFWADKFHKAKVRFKSGSERDRKIIARLKSRGKEEVLKAIEGFSLDPWRHEELVRHELKTLLRNDEQVEAGLDLYDNGGRHAVNRASAGQSQYGNANGTVGYAHPNRPGLPQYVDSGRNPVRHDFSQWSDLRGNQPLGKEEDPF